jgi:hypothetical protein
MYGLTLKFLGLLYPGDLAPAANCPGGSRTASGELAARASDPRQEQHPQSEDQFHQADGPNRFGGLCFHQLFDLLGKQSGHAHRPAGKEDGAAALKGTPAAQDDQEPEHD